MHLDDVSHDGQANAQAAIFARGGRVGLAEPVEDVRQKSGLDPYAGIFDRDLDLALGAPQARFDAPALVRELYGVRKQVPEGLLQTAGVAEDHAVRRVDHFAQDDPFRLGAGPDDVDGGMKDALNHDRLGVEFESTGDDPRGVENVLDQPVLRLRALRYHLQRVALLRRAQPAADEHARPAQDRGERRAQFVRDGGQKFIFHSVRRLGLRARGFLLAQQTFEFLLNLLALGDIHDDHIYAEHPPAAVLDRVEAGDEMARDARPGGRHRAVFDIQSRLAGLDHAAENRLDYVGRVRQDLSHRAADVLFDGFAVDLRQALVQAEVCQIGVHETEADRRRGVDRLDIRQLAARLLFAPAHGVFSPLALGDVMDDRDQTRLPAKLDRLDRDPDQNRFARFPIHRHLEVANVTLLFHNRAHAPAVRGIDREGEVSPALSDHFIAVIAEHLAPAIINLDNDAVGLASDGETIR